MKKIMKKFIRKQCRCGTSQEVARKIMPGMLSYSLASSRHVTPYVGLRYEVTTERVCADGVHHLEVSSDHDVALGMQDLIAAGGHAGGALFGAWIELTRALERLILIARTRTTPGTRLT